MLAGFLICTALSFRVSYDQQYPVVCAMTNIRWVAVREMRVKFVKSISQKAGLVLPDLA